MSRTGFYPKNGVDGPYQHLATEFNRRRELHEHNNTHGPDSRDTEISRLQHENTRLRVRIAEKDSAIEELTTFKTLSISRLAAQHDEITRLRITAASQTNLGSRPASANDSRPLIGPC
ncbi:hypothetical protein DFR70_110240 [Nocardia tenerifensis]|uniref:Uncharacterized protein n=1 Tax=Nocardia tenerifensis TaxID=228006 RepID=A0A318JYM2_9NOCA|nr:hypothetical protein [Nocardia tenerifensis]PXX60398.1 hypothetical protein DFR70_110240 [Nocardia tenerifensis]